MESNKLYVDNPALDKLCDYLLNAQRLAGLKEKIEELDKEIIRLEDAVEVLMMFTKLLNMIIIYMLE